MNHYSKALHVFDLLNSFNSDKLKLVKILLSSITCLTRVQRKMAGISVAKYLHTVHGVLVVHSHKEGRHERHVLVNRNKLLSGPDDPLGSGALQWLREIAHMFKEELGDIKMMPTTAQFNINVEEALASVDLEKVDSLLPALKEINQMKKWASRYEAHKALPVTDEKLRKIRVYKLYDTLAGMFATIRDNGILVPNTLIPGDVEALSGVIGNLHQARKVRVDNDAFVPAYKHAHPNAIEVRRDGAVYLVAEKDFDPMTLFGCECKPIGITKEQMLVENATVSEAAGGSEIPTLSSNTDLSDLSRRVVRLLPVPSNRWAAEDIAWMAQEGPLLTELRVANKRLTGCGKAAGTGPVEQCLSALHKHLKGNDTDHEKYQVLAAIRLAKMSSSLTVVQRDGQYYLEKRFC
jgi:hypothetical protein